MRRSGFTFVEVTAAIVIGAFVTLVAVGAMKSVTRSAQTVRDHSEMASEMRFVVNLILSDLDNIYMDKNPKLRKLTGGVLPVMDSEQATLTFYSLQRQKARALVPEGEVYEVAYAVMENEGKQIFTRRIWPYPDEEREPGGVLTILSERIVMFNVRFFDGSEWTDMWSEDMEEMPELIEVQLVGQLAEDKTPILRSLMVNLKRGVGMMDMENVNSDETSSSDASDMSEENTSMESIDR